MMQRTFIIGCCLILLFTQCTPKLSLSHSNFDTLNISLLIDQSVDEGMTEMLVFRLNHFIREHNRNPKYFLLTNNEEAFEENTLTIQIVENRLVSRDQQIAGVVVSAIGLSLPFVMVSAGSGFYLGFYYFPEDVSKVNLYLSEDISGLELELLSRKFTNSGFLRSYDTQLLKHGDKFDYFLSGLIRELEKSYKKMDRDVVLSER